MTRDETAAMFARRQEAHEEMDSAALGADYTDDAVIYSPVGGVHQGRDAARTFEAIFKAFAVAMRQAKEVIGAEVPSTKGVL